MAERQGGRERKEEREERKKGEEGEADGLAMARPVLRGGVAGGEVAAACGTMPRWLGREEKNRGHSRFGSGTGKRKSLNRFNQKWNKGKVAHRHVDGGEDLDRGRLGPAASCGGARKKKKPNQVLCCWMNPGYQPAQSQERTTYRHRKRRRGRQATLTSVRRRSGGVSGEKSQRKKLGEESLNLGDSGDGNQRRGKRARRISRRWPEVGKEEEEREKREERLGGGTITKEERFKGRSKWLTAAIPAAVERDRRPLKRPRGCRRTVAAPPLPVMPRKEEQGIAIPCSVSFTGPRAGVG